MASPRSVSKNGQAGLLRSDQQLLLVQAIFGATLERSKDGSELVSATEATTWSEFAAA